MKRLVKMLLCMLLLTLAISAFAGFSISVNAAVVTLPHIDDFGENASFVPTDTFAEFEFTPQSEGVLVFEFVYVVSVGTVSAPDGLILVENAAGEKVAGWKATSRANMNPVVDGEFTATDLVNGSWTASRYTVKIEIDLDDEVWSATVDKKWFPDLSVNLSCNNAANVSKLKFAFTNAGDTIDNLKIYKKVEATQTAYHYNIFVGTTQTLGINYTLGSSSDLIFESSDTSVATVNAEGVVTPVSKGTTTVTAKNGYIDFIFTVNVGDRASTITIDGDRHDMIAGQTKTLRYTTPPGTYPDTVVWVSNNTAVATVDADGVVTAHTEGTAAIAASCFDGTVWDACTVNVTIVEDPLLIEGVSIISAGSSAVLTTTSKVDYFIPDSILWEVVSAPEGTSIDATTGVFRAGGSTGTAVVKASCFDGKFSATHTITITPCSVFTYYVENGSVTIRYCDNSVTGELEIPETIYGCPVTTIGDYAFEWCRGLTSITIPNTITSIGSDAFSGCGYLRKVNITDLTAWCNIEFDNIYSNPLCYARKLYINDVLITDLVIPEGVTELKNMAFAYCYNIESLMVSESVKLIGEEAFVACSQLKIVRLPVGLESIGSDAFSSCGQLEKVVVESNNVVYPDLYMFSNEETVLYANKGSTTEIYAARWGGNFKLIETEFVTQTTATVSKGKIVLFVNAESIVWDEYLHIAIYDNDGVLVDYMSIPPVNNYKNIAVVFKDNENAAYAKVFVWDSDVGMEPVASAEKVDIVR